MSSLSTLPKGDSAWLLRKAIERIIQQISVLETNIGSSTTGNSANTQIIFNDAGTLRGDAGLTYNKTTDLLSVGAATITGDLTVDTSTLKVDSTNNRVGIVQASPLYPLHLVGEFGLEEASAGNGSKLRMIGQSTKYNFRLGKQIAVDNAFEITPSTAVGGTTFTNPVYTVTYDGIHTFLDGAGGTRMTLNSTGLGVGASPSYKLHVAGANPTAAINSTTATSSSISTLLYRNLDGNSNAYSVASIAGETAGNGGYGNLIFSTGFNGSLVERMRIDLSGNVGVGVTPSATDSTYFQALEIARVGQGLTAAKNALTGSPSSWLSNNSYATYSSGVVWNYAISQPAAQYRLFEGQHQWFNAPSGTAGNAITFTQAMTLDASGNLLVGKTASNSSVIGAELRPSGAIISTLAASTNADFALYTYSTGAAAARFYVGMSGTVFATNTTISAISDARLKENVQDIDVGLGAILALKPRKFDWKEGKGKNIKGDRGFIAQEFEQVFPQLVDEWADPSPEGEAPYKSVRQDLIPVLVKAIQELAAEVNALKNA